MSSNKESFEESLQNKVVSIGKCVGCGTCVVVCPFNCLEYSDGKPVLAKECEVCGICAQVCPRYNWSWPEMENFVFERQRKAEETFGVYRRLAIAKASDKKILVACQDGGVVTALLTYALQNELIDGAVLSGIAKDKPFYPTPLLATTQKEILNSAGTRYSYSPNILALTEGVKKKKSSLAFVGTPCQIHAIRRIQMLPLKKYSRRLAFTIGLMCTESFSYEGLMEKHVQQVLGIDLNDVRKMNIKGKIFVTTSSEVKTISLSEAKNYARKSCEFCNDFSSELADISTGGLGLEGWTFTIIRTKKGEELFSSAENAGIIQTRPVKQETGAFNLLVRLSRRKRVKVQDA